MNSPPPSPDGALARSVRRAAAASARRPRTTIALWLVFVAACVFAGAMTGTKTLTGAETGTGESARADKQVSAAGMESPAAEQILVRSPDRATTAAAAAALEARLDDVREVRAVSGPRDTPELSTAGGRTVLVQVTLRGDPDDAAEHVAPIQRTVADIARAHPEATLQQAGGGSLDKGFEEILHKDLQRAEVISLPITLVILLLAFGAVVAAAVPLLLGLTSVAAAMGAFGVISQVAPDGGTGGALVALIGLAVGVDYSLFYIRREREERRAGKDALAALDAAAATVGRAIVVSGVTVVVALAGLLFTGLAVFTSMALATIVVVAIAVIGSVTVLPATLALLGDRIDKGRLPFLGRRRPRSGGGAWGRLARTVTKHPVVALVTAVCLLGTLAIPALDLQPASSYEEALPRDTPVVVAQRAIERAFPGAPSDVELVVTARGLDARGPQLQALGERARAVTGGHGQVSVETSRDGRTAVVSIPMPNRGVTAAEDTVAALRERVTPTAGEVAPGARALLTGEAAGGVDFTNRLQTATPIVIALVLGLAFLLLVGAFRSPRARRGGDRAQPAVGRRRLRRARRGLPARVGRRAARLHEHGHGRRLAAAVRVRDPVRAVDGLHDPRARAGARGAPRRALGARGRRRGRRGHREHGDECCHRDGRRVRHLRHDAVRRQQAARCRARRRDPARRDDRARDRPAGRRHAARRRPPARPCAETGRGGLG